MPFRPFSLADTINFAQTAKFNRFKLETLQADVARKDSLREMARQSTVPTYGRAEGPPQDGAAPQIQTGEEYSPEAHQQRLEQAGEFEMAAKLEDHISKMNASERKEAEHKAEQFGVDAFSADTPEKWDIMVQKRNTELGMDQQIPFSQRDDIIDKGQSLKDLLSGDVFSFGNITFPDGKTVAARKSRSGEIQYRGDKGWVNAPTGIRFTHIGTRGTTYIGSPNKREKEDAASLIKDQWDENVPELADEDKELFKVAVASRARQLQKKEGLNWEEALDRSFNENMARVKKGEVDGGWFWFDEASTFKEPEEGSPKEVEKFTEESPAMPATQDEFNALPSGSWFKNPKDGRIMKKK